MSIIEEALQGLRGPDQQRIANVAMGWLQMLLEKNADYGSSAWESPALAPQLAAGDAILARMSDKVKRIAYLQTNAPEVKAESLADTIRDLGGYCLLWCARPDGEEVISQGVAVEVQEDLKCFGPLEVFPVVLTMPADGGHAVPQIIVGSKRQTLPPELRAKAGDRILLARQPANA